MPMFCPPQNSFRHSFQCLISILAIGAGFFIAGESLASEPEVIITRFMSNPDGSDNIENIGEKSYEMIELTNISDVAQDISNWKMRAGTYFSLSSLASPIPPNRNVIIFEGMGTNKNIDFSEGDTTYLFMNRTGSQLGDTYGDIALYNSQSTKKETIVDYVAYGKIPATTTTNYKHAIDAGIWTEGDYAPNPSKGNYLKLKNGADNNLSSDWKEDSSETESPLNSDSPPPPENTAPPENPTPSTENPSPPKKTEYSKNIRLNEFLPNPEGADKDKEYIELFNGGSKEVNLENWMLKDASKSGKYIFPEKTVIPAQGFFVIYQNEFDFTLNNSGSEEIYLLNPNEEIVSSAKYEKSQENVSFNFDSGSWKMSRWMTPGTANRFNVSTDQKIISEDIGYVKMWMNFEANISNPDNDPLKFTWDFGDGRRSYLAKTKHKYTAAAIYHIGLSVFDGSEIVSSEKTITVTEYPEENVIISSFCPNPKGSDAENEWIEIKNLARKQINLKSWSVATGWKKLSNHPIRKDFVLKSGQSRKLTRSYSAFTLNNEKNRIELRYPDGKIAFKVKYDKNNGNALENEVYEKIKGGWKWKTSKKTAKLKQPSKKTEEKTSLIVGNDLADTEAADKEEMVLGAKNENDLPIGGDTDTDQDYKKIFALPTSDVVFYNAEDAPKESLGIMEKGEEIIYVYTESGAPKSEHYALIFSKKTLKSANRAIASLLR